MLLSVGQCREVPGHVMIRRTRAIIQIDCVRELVPTPNSQLKQVHSEVTMFDDCEPYLLSRFLESKRINP